MSSEVPAEVLDRIAALVVRALARKKDDQEQKGSK